MMHSTIITEKNIGNIYGKVRRFFGTLPAEVVLYHTFGGGFTKTPKNSISYNDTICSTKQKLHVSQITLQKRKVNKTYRYIHIQYMEVQEYTWSMHVGDRIAFSSNRIIHQDTSPLYHSITDPFNHGPLYMIYEKI